MLHSIPFALIFAAILQTLEFNVEEHPVTVQLGGSDPAGLARAARLCQEWGYDEVNLNVSYWLILCDFLMIMVMVDDKHAYRSVARAGA